MTRLRTQVLPLCMQVLETDVISVHRSKNPSYLYAVHVSQEKQIDQAVVEKMLESHGWTCGWQQGWLLLDHAILVPESSPAIALSGECACLAQLLAKHETCTPCAETLRRLQRAWDEGRIAMARFARSMHADMSASLRAHQALEDIGPWLDVMEERIERSSI